MAEPSYAASKYPVREDIREAHQVVFRGFAKAGTWWTGSERLAIAAEARAARDCSLCAKRKAALSPFSIDGEHDGCGQLAPLDTRGHEDTPGALHLRRRHAAVVARVAVDLRHDHDFHGVEAGPAERREMSTTNC